MLYTISSAHRLINALVSQSEREFFVVYTALRRIRDTAPNDDLLRFEVDRASETLQRLMQNADCIDPGLTLDGTGRTDTLSPHS